METFAPRGNIYGPILPQFALDAPITSGAKIMYALLCNYASDKDHCWPAQATLAAKLSCSVSSVKNYLAELVNAKLISIRREQYRSCIYYILRPAALKETKAASRKPEIAPQQPKNDHAQPKTAYLNNLNKQEKEKTPPLPPAPVPRSQPPASGPVGGGGFSFQDFEKAWEAYPKKEALGLARHAWNQLRQNGQLPSLSDLLAAIKRFTLTESWQREHGRFIPQMSNWLRGERWLDALSPEEEQAVRQRQERERMELACKREQEAREAKRKVERELLRPIYAAFKAKFPADQRRDGLESMLHGTWLYLHAKYGGPTAADVPENNTQNMDDFMKGYQRRCEQSAYHAARAAPVNEERPVKCGELLKNGDFLSRLFPAAQVCAAV